MKEYEIFSELKVPKNSNIIVRLDGRSFHTLTRDLGLEKPYDVDFYRAMGEVCKDLFIEFSPSFIYTFSDEISILLNDIPFNGRIEKIDSVIASFTSSSFLMHFDRDFKKPVAFDSRVIPVDDANIVNYFKWRQDEAWRNCINSYASNFLKSKYSNDEVNDKLNGLKSSDVHELLFQNGINLNDVETWKKRGVGIYKRNKKVEGFNKKENRNQISYRKYLYVDLDIPIFNEDFFREIDVIK